MHAHFLNKVGGSCADRLPKGINHRLPSYSPRRKLPSNHCDGNLALLAQHIAFAVSAGQAWRSTSSRGGARACGARHQFRRRAGIGACAAAAARPGPAPSTDTGAAAEAARARNRRRCAVAVAARGRNRRRCGSGSGGGICAWCEAGRRAAGSAAARCRHRAGRRAACIGVSAAAIPVAVTGPGAAGRGRHQRGGGSGLDGAATVRNGGRGGNGTAAVTGPGGARPESAPGCQ